MCVCVCVLPTSQGQPAMVRWLMVWQYGVCGCRALGPLQWTLLCLCGLEADGQSCDALRRTQHRSLRSRRDAGGGVQGPEQCCKNSTCESRWGSTHERHTQRGKELHWAGVDVINIVPAPPTLTDTDNLNCGYRQWCLAKTAPLLLVWSVWMCVTVHVSFSYTLYGISQEVYSRFRFQFLRFRFQSSSIHLLFFKILQ